jgi:hypothetical protein
MPQEAQRRCRLLHTIELGPAIAATYRNRAAIYHELGERNSPAMTTKPRCLDRNAELIPEVYRK